MGSYISLAICTEIEADGDSLRSENKELIISEKISQKISLDNYINIGSLHWQIKEEVASPLNILKLIKNIFPEIELSEVA